MREATGPTLQSHQIVCLPTKNDAQDWSLSHMKRHLQCAEQQKSPSNVTKHCGCHEKWPSKIRQKFAENSWNVIYTDQSPSVRNPHATSIGTRTSPYTAPTTKSDTWISRNTVPGTESDSWTWPNHAMSFVYRKFLHLNFLRTFLLFASKLSRRVISEKNQCASYSSQFSASHPRHFPIYSLLASILSRHLFSLGIYSLWASILSWHLFPLGIYSLLASIVSWHFLWLYYIIYYIILYSIIFWYIL